MFLIFYLIIVSIYNLVIVQNCEVDLETPYGTLTGEKRSNYYAFENVPYAEPPINDKRFEPVGIYNGRWDDKRNARQAGPDCVQYDHASFSVIGEEDCLSLNIYTKDYASKGKLPVIFYIHGGAFIFGHGILYGAEHIMQYMDAVYVNLNYRLGPMGFLSTEDDVVPGNMGLKDQVTALHWLKKNIALFGGDPKQITITGFSAGGASVHLHYLSPLSRGLFSRGISHSGCSLNPWVMVEGSAEKARQLADHLGCKTNTNVEMIKCLKTKPAREIAHSVSLFQPFLFNPFSPFAVVVEKPSDKAFLTKAPLELLKSNDVAQLPWILSFTKDEGLYPGSEYVPHLKELDKRWEELAPHILDFNRTIAKSRHAEVANKIKAYYIKDGSINRNTYLQIIQMVTDRLYNTGFEVALRLHAKYNSADTYVYYYQFHANYSIPQIIYKDDVLFQKVVSHGDDVFLIYSNEFREGNHPYTEEELKMLPKLIEIYCSFTKNKIVKYGGVRIESVTIGKDNSFNYLLVEDPTRITMDRLVDISSVPFWKTIPFEGLDNIFNEF